MILLIIKLNLDLTYYFKQLKTILKRQTGSNNCLIDYSKTNLKMQFILAINLHLFIKI